MAANVVIKQINGQYTDDKGTIPAGQVGSETGSGAVIGNGYTLTAGHIVFEFNRNSAAPAVTSSAAGILDYKGYQAAYLSAAKSSYNKDSSTYPRNDLIEAKLFSLDSVVIADSNATVNSNSAGLGAFSANSDLLNTKTSLYNSSDVYRDGLNTGHVSGKITGIYQGDLQFNKTANTDQTLPGDSGGAYSLSYNGRTYILGTQSSNQGSVTALGTILSTQDVNTITDQITSTLKGNISKLEPTNLFVGSVSDNIIAASFRPDIILGLDGADTLDGGDRADATRWANDQLFGGDGNDTLIAGKGDNLYHGGNQNLAQAGDLTLDGSDTVDYSAMTQTATDPSLGIKVQITTTLINKTWPTNKDFSHASFVTDLGRDRAIDTLISVENVTGTSADDIVQITELSKMTLATTKNINGVDKRVGGIDTVDLGGENLSSRYKGDYVDLSALNESAKVTMNDSTLVVAAAVDATRFVTIKNDEHITGSKQNDLFQAQGQTAAIDFASGGGHDLVETSAGGNYDLLLQNLKPSDVTIIAGGEDLYNGYGTPSADPSYRGIAFEFVGFKINATGDTIIFTDNSRAIGAANTPDEAASGSNYAAAHSALSSVTFGNGLKWSANDLWTHVLKQDAAPVLYDLTYRGSFAPSAEPGKNYTSIDAYNSYLNDKYFQADPLSSTSSTAAMANPSKTERSFTAMADTVNTTPANSARYESGTSMPSGVITTTSAVIGTTDQTNASPPLGQKQPTVGSSSTAEMLIGGKTAEATAELITPSSYQQDLAGALQTLRAHNQNRINDLPTTFDLSSFSSPNQQGSRAWTGSQHAIPIEAVSATIYNRMIHEMAAFHSGGSIGGDERMPTRLQEQVGHSPALAISH